MTTQEDVIRIKTRLNCAFLALEKDHGFITDEGNHCCQGCTCAFLSQKYEEEGKAYKAYAFYHEQDAEGLENNGKIYIAFGAFSPEDDDERDEWAGEKIKEAIERTGLTVKWDGSSATRILVSI